MPEQNYQINQPVVATVDQIFPFGVFVRLPDETPAYIRRRELTQSGDVDPQQVVSKGEQLKALVVSLAEGDQNLELSVRRAEPDPWDIFVKTHQARDTVTGTVKRILRRGIFVEIIPGVEGFISLSEMATWPVTQPDDLFWIGDRVEAMITSLHRSSKRLRLSIRQQMKHELLVGNIMLKLSREEEETTEESIEDDGQSEPYPERLDPLLSGQIGRVLVVDDHSEVRLPLVKWFARHNFVVDGAGSFEEAQDCIRRAGYGLALIDLDLSGEDGLNIITLIKEVSPETAVAVMSIPDRIAERSEELIELGVVDAFAKPLNLDEIREMLIRLGRGEPLASSLMTAEPPDQNRDSLQLLAERMYSSQSLATRLDVALEELFHSVQAEKGLIFHLDPTSGQVSIMAELGDLPLNHQAIYSLVQSPVKDLIYEQRKILETHISLWSKARFSKLLDLLPFESCLGLPISVGGKIEHALFLFHRQPNRFTEQHLQEAQITAKLCSVALENQALEERIRAISPFFLSGQLAAGFGHEVYNQMSGLEIQVRNLRADCKRLNSESPSTEDLTELGRASEELFSVTQDMRETVALFRELIRADREEAIEISEIINRTIHLIKPTANRFRVHIEITELATNLPPIMGSPVRLQQAFLNLMLNGVQQTAQKMDQWSEGRGKLQIKTGWQADQSYPICIYFTDNGPGIHHQLWQKIFALGFSTRPKGTGLGLFITHSLIESMGGQVFVERSAIPIGTTFCVQLPGDKR